MLKKCLPILMTMLAALSATAHTQDAVLPLRLERSVPLSGVKGRLDHMAVDLERQLLFVAALGNNTLEVIDLKAGERIRSIEGLNEPQGVVYLPEFQKLVVANGGDGSCKIFDGNSWDLSGMVKYPENADNLRFDRRTNFIYVGYGNGALGIIHIKDGKRMGDILLEGHPESFQLEESGPRIFVNVPTANHVAVVDRDRLEVIARWPLGDEKGNFPMALDESNHRLFIGCRSPAKLIIYDTQSGKTVGGLDIAGDLDDLFYDGKNRRIYASGGEGFLYVFEQNDPDHYALSMRLATAEGARTSLFVPEQGRLYLAVPHRGERQAEIRVYAVQP